MARGLARGPAIPETATGIKGTILGFVRRLVGRASLAERERQRNFNLALLELIEDERRQLAAATGEIQREVAAARIELDSLLRLAVERNDALLSAVDRKAETALARVRDVALPLLASPPREAAEEWLYRRLEEGLRGGEPEVREALAPYVEYARRSAPVLDVGCGRGEFLELCRDAGIEASGYDTNARSVADLQARGINATIAAIPTCFARPRGRFGRVDLRRARRRAPPGERAARSLCRGAPGAPSRRVPHARDPECGIAGGLRLRLLARSDPPRPAPRRGSDAPRARVRLRRRGSPRDPSVPGQPPVAIPEGAAPEVRHLAEQLNEILFAPQDLRLVLRRA